MDKQEDNKRLTEINYQLLSQLYYTPLSLADIDHLAELFLSETYSDPLLIAWSELITKAQSIDLNQIKQEFQNLFIGISHGEVIPFASHYIDGHLMGNTLIKLREFLTHFNIEHHVEVSEPEDHISLLFSTMQILIETNQEHKAFFTLFIKPWYLQFCQDLQQASSAQFYTQLAQITVLFLNEEAQKYMNQHD